MSDRDTWTFIAIWIGISLIAIAVAAVVNVVIAIVTAPWFPVAMAAVAVVGASAVVAYMWERSQRW